MFLREKSERKMKSIEIILYGFPQPIFPSLFKIIYEQIHVSIEIKKVKSFAKT